MEGFYKICCQSKMKETLPSIMIVVMTTICAQFPSSNYTKLLENITNFFSFFSRLKYRHRSHESECLLVNY